ncbi:alpha/beta hydrolase-fold protein [Caulobacter sp. BE254]|uniref:alpha/beta hydrolase n=1 Tax=Caulobacter sp. BE254 TaxID=2817720 RepID=UPI00286124E5|nr:alpha/beta hydrolase-fold protein [Caulobacter sp. BE254]MDR7114681.1 enterochelin esterase-like enzyme [Caulobacter sp. BE254]
MAILLAASGADLRAAAAPVAASAKAVTVERIKVHGAALEGNLEGESPDRDVVVYLPPGYAADKARRYPVVYALHGYGLTVDGFAGLLQTPQTAEGAFAAGAPGMIVVLPDTQTLHNGSMYSSSVTIGDWEGFITRDLVAYVDAHYRTLPDRLSRGLAGHSMGGYGVARLGMKHPETFGALYIMSPCCLSAREAPPPGDAAAVEAVKTREEATRLGFLPRATFAVAAAWSPNPKKPPFYVDLPTSNGVVDRSVLARWAANAPLSMLDQYIFNLRRYQAIAIDVGDRDGLKVDAAELHDRLVASGVANTFEIYSGDHGSAVASRFQNNVLPFFGRVLRSSGE